jgi:uncharacterized membrane protein YeaQ/YmgE (transglycosylase-associated protein family)
MTLESAVVFVVVGLIAGFLASRIVLGKGRGWLMSIVIGILGAIVGGWLASELHVSIHIGPSIVNQTIIAFVGALLLLVFWRAVFRGATK